MNSTDTTSNLGPGEEAGRADNARARPLPSGMLQLAIAAAIAVAAGLLVFPI